MSGFDDDGAAAAAAPAAAAAAAPSPGASNRHRVGGVRKGKVPVYVMLPLDTVSRHGKLQRVDELSERLAALKRCGVEGVMVDVWWGIVERAGPLHYDWGAYLHLVRIVAALDLRLHAVLSFHSCGANRDDDYHVPLPQWVTDAVARDPDGLLFADRAGSKSDEYLSLWADHAPMPMLPNPSPPPPPPPPDREGDAAAVGAGGGVDAGGAADAGAGADAATADPRVRSPVPPRTPLDCYRDMMASFRNALAPHLGTVVTEVLVGCGPCGELRYPAYAMSRGWTFPGVGEFQCYDRRALESLAAAATAAGRPEWGNGGPHDAGHYNSHPDDTGFFSNGAGVFGERGEGFGLLVGGGGSGGSVGGGGSIEAGMDSAGERKRPFASSRNTSRSSLDSPGGGDEWKGIDSGVGHKGGLIGRIWSLEDVSSAAAAAAAATPPVPNGRWDSEYGRFFLGWYSGELVAHGERVLGAAAEVFAGTGARLAVKCAGIHWWYRTRSHAAELTTGYYNVEGGQDDDEGDDGNASPRGGGGEGDDDGEMTEAAATTTAMATATGGGVGGGGVPGYDRIMSACKAVGAAVTFTCAEMNDGEHTPFHMCGPEGLLRQVVETAGRQDVEVAAENALYRCDAAAFRQIVRNCKGEDDGVEGKPPAMHSFTFLRLCDSLMEEGNFAEFASFVRNMNE